MKLTRKQLKLVAFLEHSKGVNLKELNEILFPRSVINSLIKKGVVAEVEGKLVSKFTK